MTTDDNQGAQAPDTTYIHKAHKTREFFTCYNRMVNGYLSAEATGVYVHLLSKPVTWVIHQRSVENVFGITWRASKRIFTELEDKHILTPRTMERDQDGKLTGVSHRMFYELPEDNPDHPGHSTVSNETEFTAPSTVYNVTQISVNGGIEKKELSSKKEQSVRGKPARAQDPLFDWIAANLFGNPEKITRGLGSRIGKVISELPDGITPDDLAQWALWFDKKNIDRPRDGVKLAASIREWEAKGNVTRGLYTDLQRHGITPTGNPVFDSRLLERARRNHA
jgi:hypothetical protein